MFHFLKESLEPWARGEWSPRTTRIGLIGRKLGTTCMWDNKGRKIMTTMIHVRRDIINKLKDRFPCLKKCFVCFKNFGKCKTVILYHLRNRKLTVQMWIIYRLRTTTWSTTSPPRSGPRGWWRRRGTGRSCSSQTSPSAKVRRKDTYFIVKS